jgi:hypothetical protein
MNNINDAFQEAVSHLRAGLEAWNRAFTSPPGPTPVVPGTELSLPKWDIWSEGFVVTGEAGTAMKMATRVRAATFEEAVRFAAERSHEPWLWDLDRMTYWGCRLYSTEHEARRSFG